MNAARRYHYDQLPEAVLPAVVRDGDDLEAVAKTTELIARSLQALAAGRAVGPAKVRAWYTGSDGPRPLEVLDTYYPDLDELEPVLLEQVMECRLALTTAVSPVLLLAVQKVKQSGGARPVLEARPEPRGGVTPDLVSPSTARE